MLITTHVRQFSIYYKQKRIIWRETAACINTRGRPAGEKLCRENWFCLKKKNKTKKAQQYNLLLFAQDALNYEYVKTPGLSNAHHLPEVHRKLRCRQSSFTPRPARSAVAVIIQCPTSKDTQVPSCSSTAFLGACYTEHTGLWCY